MESNKYVTVSSQPDYSHIKYENAAWRQQYTREVYARTQDEKYRGPIPGDGDVYPVHEWVKFEVVQKGRPIQLHTYKYPAENERKAVFIIFHGLNSHLGKSAHIAKALAKHGVESVGFDCRGFGRSEGIRGWCESIETHIADCVKFIEIIEKEYKGSRIFLGGQSWGGQTAYKLALTYPERFAGVVLYAPAIKDNKIHVPLAKVFGRIIGCLMPQLQTVAQTHGFANRNPAVGEQTRLDQFSYQGRLIPGTVRTILNASDAVEGTFAEFKTPFIILTAGADKLVDPLLGFDFMKLSPSVDKTHIFYENCWHNMWAEEEIYDAIQQTVKWITQRAK